MTSDTTTRVYEAMFLVDTGDAANWDDLTKHLANILTRNGAEIIGLTRWDERKLTYTVKSHKRGTYVLAFFCLTSGKAVNEIEHDCRLSEKVVRALLLKADHFTVADMRMQLGEDLREDVARKLMAERGEKETVAAVVAAKPSHTGEEVTPAGGGEGTSERPGRFGRSDRFDRGPRSNRY